MHTSEVLVGENNCSENIVLNIIAITRADPEIFFGGVNLFICVWSKGHFYINLIG